MEASLLGGEAEDLERLRELGVPLARGWVCPITVDLGELADFLAAQLRASAPPRRASMPPIERVEPRIKLRPWFRTVAQRERSRAHWSSPDVADPAELRAELEGFVERARAQSRGGAVMIRALACDAGLSGFATSTSSTDGDPAYVAVRLADRPAWKIERKSMRIVEEGDGALVPALVERVADLADRAQLALGQPVEIEWVISGGRPAVARVSPVAPTFRFTDETYRLVEVLWHDEGPMAPLSVDALDKALREDGDPVDEARVVRTFARPYRRLEAGRSRSGERRQSFLGATSRAARVVADATRPIAAARAFSRTLDDRMRAFDADALERMDDSDLAKALRERQRVVVEAYVLLDRGRQATAAVLGALEAALGTIPQDCVHGLAAIRRTRKRRRLDERLAKAAARLGELPRELDPSPPSVRQTFAELRRELATERPLGLDVLPPAYGANDASLVAGMRAAVDGRAERAEREQRGAIRRLSATARARPLGRGRSALASTLMMMLERLAVAKGRVAEGLADANLRLRAVAIVVGERLVERGVLDGPEDALFLHVAELSDALFGEPGAYTARVRLRREEDARWSAFSPPTRLLGRRPQ
ncbi:MAG: hypothetical protein AB7S26_09650 [Sandaracinaceae bacterium]